MNKKTMLIAIFLNTALLFTSLTYNFYDSHELYMLDKNSNNVRVLVTEKGNNVVISLFLTDEVAEVFIENIKYQKKNR